MERGLQRQTPDRHMETERNKKRRNNSAALASGRELHTYRYATVRKYAKFINNIRQFVVDWVQNTCTSLNQVWW